MQMVMVSVRDHKSELYGRPYFAVSEGAAIRSFHDEVNRADQENILNRHPEDFTLFKLGMFSDSEGTFEIITPKALIHGKECRQIEEHKISKV